MQVSPHNCKLSKCETHKANEPVRLTEREVEGECKESEGGKQVASHWLLLQRLLHFFSPLCYALSVMGQPPAATTPAVCCCCSRMSVDNRVSENMHSPPLVLVLALQCIINRLLRLARAALLLSGVR